MSEQWPTFVARKNPGSGWGVDILWPDGETEAIKGFITEYDALKWITEHENAKGVAGKNTNETRSGSATPSATAGESDGGAFQYCRARMVDMRKVELQNGAMP
jgi:hypothetical protein